MPDIAGPLNNVAIGAVSVKESDWIGGFHTVDDIAARDALLTSGAAALGMRVSVRSTGALYRLDSLAPVWTQLLNGYLVVADVAARNAVPAGDRFEGLLIYSIASGLQWILGAGLADADFEIVQNLNPALFTVDPAVGIAVHTIYVETTGDDVNGEGTVADPFLTPQKAMEATRGQSGAIVVVRLGLGTFNVDDGPSSFLFVQGVHEFGVSLQGTTIEVEDFPSFVSDGNVPGKVSQRRIDVGAYAPALVEGTHFLNSTFPGNEAFPTYYPVLSSSASPKIDFVGFAPPTADAQIVTLGTTLTTTAGQMSIRGGAGGITLQGIKMRSASGFISLIDAGAGHCDFSNLGGTDFVNWGGARFLRSLYVDCDGFTITNLSGYLLDSLVNRGQMLIHGTFSNFTIPLSRNTNRHTGAAYEIGTRGFGDRKPTALFMGAFDLEAGSGILMEGVGCNCTLQTDINVEAACSRALLMRAGATLREASGSADFVGTTTGVCVVIQSGAFLEDTIRMFEGHLDNSGSPGANQIEVGGNAPATFAGAPYTDFALGNASQGAMAVL